MLKHLIQVLPSTPAYAHCDVPCGIYTPKHAQIAAATCVRMIELIGELPKENRSNEEENKFTRCVLTKEEHARKCKEELLILWTDYFKPEHLEKYPDLHDTFWKAAKLCSKVKQSVDAAATKELYDSVEAIGKIFDETKANK